MIFHETPQMGLSPTHRGNYQLDGRLTEPRCCTRYDTSRVRALSVDDFRTRSREAALETFRIHYVFGVVHI